MKNDMYYEMKHAGLTRKLPLCPISDELMIGAFVIFGDMELTTACSKALLARCPAQDITNAAYVALFESPCNPRFV